MASRNCCYSLLIFPLRVAFLAGVFGFYAISAEPLPDSPLNDDKRLEAFADVSEEWGRGVEAVIEKAYRECFRTLLIDGNIRTLRLPFAENSERSELTETNLEVAGGGKADPSELWGLIEGHLASADFASYLAALSDGREKLIVFDIEARSWSASGDRFSIERLLAGLYPGLPHRPVVLVSGKGASTSDIYNYLYCVGRVGIDCSGFVWHVLRAIASAGGLDLDKSFGRGAGLAKGVKPSLFVGTWTYDPRSGKTRAVPDEIDKLLPGDIILFRGEDGSFIHSCVIQSIDLAAGRLRYLQSTDESPSDDRGVHESILLFDPERPATSLKDPSLRWLQRRGVPFAGEPAPAFNDDGERYRAYADIGGGIVVRLKALEKIIGRLRSRK
jgi:hypothetical protein